MNTSQGMAYRESRESGQRAYSLSILHGKSRYPHVLSVLPRKSMILKPVELFLTQERWVAGPESSVGFERFVTTAESQRGKRAPLVLHVESRLIPGPSEDGRGLLRNQLKPLAGGLLLQRFEVGPPLRLVSRL
jgi:hypothetical protein